MEIAVLADIHSNYIALDRCMEYALERGIRQFIFLGDYLGEMAYPERTMERLYDYAERYQCIFIRGNKEDYWINHRTSGAVGWREYDSTTGALWYVYHRITDRDMDFFESLPVSMCLEYEGMPPITVCHGSPVSTRERLGVGEESTKRALEQSDTDLILCAHTHIQGKTVHAGKSVINPGSVGLSLEARSKSQFLILHGEICHGAGSWQEEFVSLDYDREAVIRQLSESGLAERAPGWCKVTEYGLREPERELGHAYVLDRVMELCRKETGRCDWPDIPEKYWEMEIQKLGL